MSAVAAEPASDAATVIEADAAPSAERLEMPLPEDARTVFLGGIFVLAVLAALYVAAEIVLPIMLAFVLNLLLLPIVRLCERVRLPRAVGGMLALMLLVSVVGGLGTALSGPAGSWAERLPQAVPKLHDQLRFLQRPFNAAQDMVAQVQGTTAGTARTSDATPVRLAGLFDTLFSGTRALAAGLVTTLIVLFYLLVFGETFLRRTVEILPRFKDKRVAVEISLRIQQDVSAYLVTISAINAVVGVATGGMMWMCGVADPVLWGFTAFVLNFVPILGPLLGVVLFVLVGMLSLGAHWMALLPAALYFAIHLIEGDMVTPLLLARRFTINPVALVLGLVFWYWMWGIPGAVLAVPMLAITKIVCDRVRPLKALGHFLEG
jgi:predicted PurR-regulated permease PerM